MKTYLFILLLILVISGCSNVVYLDDSEEKRWFESAAPISEKLINTLLENKYEEHIQLWSENVDQSDKASFSQGSKNLKSQLGNLNGLIQYDVAQEGDYVTVGYKADFDNEKDVLIQVVFHKDNPNKVEGLEIG